MAVQHLPALIEAGKLHYLLEQKCDDDGSVSPWGKFWQGLVCPDGLIFQQNDAPLGLMTVESIIKAKPKAARTRDWLTLLHKEDNNRLDMYSFIGKNLPELTENRRQASHVSAQHVWRKVKSQSNAESLGAFQSDSSDAIREALQIRHDQVLAGRIAPLYRRVGARFRTRHVAPNQEARCRQAVCQSRLVFTAEEEDFLRGPVTIDEIVQSLGLLRKTTSCKSVAHFTLVGQTPDDDLRKEVIVDATKNGPGNLQHGEVNRVMKEQWEQRNAVKRILPSFMHLNFQQPAFPTLTKGTAAASHYYRGTKAGERRRCPV